jgi:hypothetical protein
MYNGQVIFSDDSLEFPAWYAFNNDKVSYPYAEIFSFNNEFYLGYELEEPLNKALTSYFIEFDPTAKPSQLVVEISEDGNTYQEVFNKSSNIQNIESGVLDNYVGYQYFRYKFDYLSSSSSSSSILNIKVKKAQFFYQDNSSINFQKYFSKIPGYGNTTINFENKILTGNIQDPFGLVPAVYYATGILTGTITDNVGSFTWSNIFLESIGETGNVYLDYVTGYTQSTGVIEIDAFYKNKLLNFDIININSVNFTYVTGVPQNLFEFNTIEDLLKILNSGSQGLLDSTLQNTVGVSGYIDYTYPYHKIYLTSVSRSGEEGNNNRIYRDCFDLNTIIIKDRYFQGGKTLRPETNNWIGTFFNTFEEITAENTGVYNRNIIENTAAVTQDIAWEDNFSGNYFITTGIRNPNSQQTFSGVLMKFDSDLNKYYSSGIIPGGSSLYVYTGFKFNILKPNPYNIQNNLAKYIISGKDFIYSGIIVG